MPPKKCTISRYEHSMCITRRRDEAALEMVHVGGLWLPMGVRAPGSRFGRYT